MSWKDWSAWFNADTEREKETNADDTLPCDMDVFESP
jgi:hypothetical protein